MGPWPGSRLAGSAFTLSRRVAPGITRRCRRLLRQHWPLLVVLAYAAALRVVVLLAYRPALIFPDSERYLQYAQQYIAGHWSPDWLRTSGYSLLLIPAVLIHNLIVVPLAQHVLGLATAVLIYAVLVHFGSRRWLAALATVPVLSDPLQLDIEQYVLTDVSATFLVTAALVVLVWKRGEIGRVAPVVAGLLLAAATDIRQSDLIVIIPAAVYIVAAVRPWRRLAVRASLLIAGFLLPVVGYLGWFQVARGQFDFVSYNGEFMYGRIAQFIDCTGVPMPAYERHLCPQQPPAQRNPDFYMWAPQSPQVTLKAPPGMSKDDIIIDFDRRIIEHEPLTYLKVMAGDVLYSFSPVRGAGPEQYPIWYHQFHPYYPVYMGAIATLRTAGHTGPTVEPALADFLSGYGRYFYVPGPLLAAGLALGLAGMAGIGQARRSGLRAACLLFTLGTIAAVEPPFVISTFDWRYELPQLSLVPVAAVLGVTALVGRRRDAAPGTSPANSDQSVRRCSADGTSTGQSS
ncbi:MAG: ArnT family glycosyltransferase [Streptosporangiaceae bacterium]